MWGQLGCCWSPGCLPCRWLGPRALALRVLVLRLELPEGPAIRDAGWRLVTAALGAVAPTLQELQASSELAPVVFAPVPEPRTVEPCRIGLKEDSLLTTPPCSLRGRGRWKWAAGWSP